MSNDYMDTVRTYAKEILAVPADEMEHVLETVGTLSVSMQDAYECKDARLAELLVLYRCTTLTWIDKSIRTPRMCLLAVKGAPWMIHCIAPEDAGDLYPEICLIAMNYSALNLEHVPADAQAAHPEICEAALRKDGNALKFVAHQTPHLCRLAVQNNGFALQHVKEQTPELAWMAIKRDGGAIAYVNTPQTGLRPARTALGWTLEPQ